MTTHTTRAAAYPPLALAAALAVVWTMAAVIRPTATFHLAPVLILLTPLASNEKGALRNLLEFAGVAVIALATILVLALANLMRGPSLLPFGGPLTEALLFTVAGAVMLLAAGLLTARRRV